MGFWHKNSFAMQQFFRQNHDYQPLTPRASHWATNI